VYCLNLLIYELSFKKWPNTGSSKGIQRLRGLLGCLKKDRDAVGTHHARSPRPEQEKTVVDLVVGATSN